jgi:hypothetical protein
MVPYIYFNNLRVLANLCSFVENLNHMMFEFQQVDIYLLIHIYLNIVHNICFVLAFT